MPSEKGGTNVSEPSSKEGYSPNDGQTFSGGRARERILVFGIQGVGKSKTALDIARRINHRMFIVDNDNAYDRLLDTEYSDLTVGGEWRNGQEDTSASQTNGQLYIYHCSSGRGDDWPINRAAISSSFTAAERNEWVVIDNMPNLWEGVQQWYTIEAYGKTTEDQFMTIRKRMVAKYPDPEELKKHGAIEEMLTDWTFVNAQYNPGVRGFILNAQCHVLYTSTEKKISGMQNDREVNNLYSGFMPAGQKMVGHDVHTVLRLGKDVTARETKYWMDSVKDRGRMEMKRKQWSRFDVDYLELIGGWRWGEE